MEVKRKAKRVSVKPVTGDGRGYCRLLVVPVGTANEPTACLLRSHRRSLKLEPEPGGWFET